MKEKIKIVNDMEDSTWKLALFKSLYSSLKWSFQTKALRAFLRQQLMVLELIAYIGKRQSWLVSMPIFVLERTQTAPTATNQR